MNYLTGDIWESDRDVLVIPVNCVGVPGKGLAFQWAEREDTGEYKRDCNLGRFRPGSIRQYGRVLALATKKDWRNPSKLEWVEMGLLRVALFQERTHKSVALPQVGCGLGGLSWERQVKPLVEEVFGSSLFAIDIYEA